MSIVADDVFAERIAQYIEQNPDASAPAVRGRFLIEPTDEQREFVESMLSNAGWSNAAEIDSAEDRSRVEA
jgi:hypothetical protein